MGYHVADASKLEWVDRPLEGQAVVLFYGAPPVDEGADFFDDPGEL